MRFEKWTRGLGQQGRDRWLSLLGLLAVITECSEIPVSIFAVTCNELDLGMKSAKETRPRKREGKRTPWIQLCLKLTSQLAFPLESQLLEHINYPFQHLHPNILN